MKKVFLPAFSLFLVLAAIEILIIHVPYAGAQAKIINVPSDYYTIQEAINAANNGDTVIVDIGTYSENINFLGKAITVRSTNPYDPNIAAKTIIDGSQDESVVTFNTNEGNNSELSGFTIQNGIADNFGAGINCINSSPTIHHCIIRDNRQIADIGIGGAGIACTENSSPNIHDCDIVNNIANFGSGAGIYCDDSSATIVYCTIRDNSALFNTGGGIYLNNSDVYMEECNISNNNAFERGGGIMCDGNSSLTIDNCLISKNIANGVSNMSFGGGIFCGSSSVEIINCTISDNRATWNGSGIYYYNSTSNITNCIIYNKYYIAPIEIYADTNTSLNVTYSCIQGGFTGTGNIEADPFFVDPNVGDYRLLSNSPCIDSCNPNITDPCGGIDYDLNHIGRPQDGDNNGSCIFDMGAYELCPDSDGDGICGVDDPCPNDPNNNTSNADGDNFMVCEGDCDDSDPNFNPDAQEICDGKDNDCDGTIDEGFIDTDDDGIADCVDECPNDPNNECFDYSLYIEPDTMKIISFVHTTDSRVAISVFGDVVSKNYHYPKLFKIGTYNPELGNYIEYGENLIIEPGRGYWFYAKNGLDIFFNDVIPVSPDDFELELLFDPNTNDGWNMIACPYNYNYLWDDVLVLGCDPEQKTISELAMENDCNCIDRLLLWKWENGTYTYYDPDPNSTCGNEPNEYERDSDPNMRPNEGYWVKVKKENVFLRFPPLNIPRVKNTQPDVLISNITSQEKELPSASGNAVTAAGGDSPPAPLGGFKPDGDGSSKTESGGCFINNMYFGLPKDTR